MAIDIQALEANYQPLDLGFGRTKQSQKKKKNFFVDQVSTVGGILGGIGGSFVAPIAGTAAGAGLGSALGETLENALTGERLTKNVGKEAALGAIFGAGPIKLLKGAGAGAKALATGADDVVGAASRAATTSIFNRGARIGASGAANVADDLVKPATKTLKTSVQGRVNALGDKALESQYGTIGKNVARETNPTETISQLANYGITKPADAERIAGLITGSDGLLTNAVAGAAGNAKPVPLSGIKTVLKSSITEMGLEKKYAKSVSDTVEAQLKAAQKEGGSPTAILKAMRNLEKRAANLEGKGGNYRLSTPERIDQANVLKAVKNELQDRLYNTAGANSNLPAVLTPELREQLIQLNPGNKQWQSFVDNNIMKSKDIGALRTAQKPFVNISKIIKEADINSMTFGGRNSGVSNGGSVPSMVLNAIAENVKKPAYRAISKPLRSFGQPIVEAGSGNQGVRGGIGIAARVGIPNSLENALSDYSSGPIAPNTSMTTNASTNSAASTPSITNIPEQYQNSLEMSSSPYSRENLIYDIQRDPQNANKYIEYFTQLEEIFNPEVKQKPLNQGQQERQDLLNALTLTEQAVEGGSINYGPVGSRIEGLKSMFNAADPETLSYKNTVSGLRAAITKARAGASLTPGEMKLLAQYTPSDTNSEQVVRSKLAALRQLYGTQAPVGGGSLEDALRSMQGAY